MSRFSLNRGSGFHLTFDNNWTVSVQFGGVMNLKILILFLIIGMEQAGKGESVRSSNAEIAVWSNRIGDSDLIWLENATVRGYNTANEVAQVIHKVSTAKSTLTSKQMTKRLSNIWK